MLYSSARPFFFQTTYHLSKSAVFYRIIVEQWNICLDRFKFKTLYDYRIRIQNLEIQPGNYLSAFNNILTISYLCFCRLKNKFALNKDLTYSNSKKIQLFKLKKNHTEQTLFTKLLSSTYMKIDCEFEIHIYIVNV